MLVNEHRSSSTLGCLLQSLPPTSRWSISASIIFLFFVALPAVCGADHGAEVKRPAVLRVAITSTCVCGLSYCDMLEFMSIQNVVFLSGFVIYPSCSARERMYNR